MTIHVVNRATAVGPFAYGPMLGTARQSVQFAAGPVVQTAVAGDIVVVLDPAYAGGKQHFRIDEIRPNSMHDGKVWFVKASRPHGDPRQISLADRWPQPAAPIDTLDEFGDRS